MPDRTMRPRSRRMRAGALAAAAAAIALLPPSAGAAPAPSLATPSIEPVVVLPPSTLPGLSKPDLVVSQGDQYRFTVKNVGFALAPTSVATVTTAGSYSVPPLLPGQSATFPIAACDLDSWGDMTIRVDAARQITELSETNNSRTVFALC
jgi:subtilase family serine protease